MERRLSQISTTSNRLRPERKITEILNSDEIELNISHIKNQFRLQDLEDLFNRYRQKINHGYFTLFLILQFVLNLSQLIIVVTTNMPKETIRIVLPDITLYAICTFLPIIGIFISECYIKKHPHVLQGAAIIAFLPMYLIDIGLPIYHSIQYEKHYIPIYTTQLIIACYIFIAIKKNAVAFGFGIVVTCTHLLILYFFTYKDSSNLVKRIISDLLYFVCINGLGLYFRYMNEIVERRGFLNRRACVLSNLDLEYTKTQEDTLMKSILPEHILDKVKSSIDMEKSEIIQSSIKNPFTVNMDSYKNVTILYADIVNYTQMTTKLTPAKKLVETLNDLFGSFDDASEELDVLRIKFLGDCYYCVAGLPPQSITNHAEACVDLGLRMIEIIKRVRQEQDVDVNMRIGVHSGDIIGGTIGTMKLQFDVWSTDVHIANLMETTGSPGKVHITNQTKAQLNKKYYIKSTNVGSTDERLKKYNLKTFLVSPKEDILLPVGKVLDIISEKNSTLILNPTNLPNMQQSYQRKDLRRASGNPNLEKLKNTNQIERRFSGNPYLERRASGNPTLERRMNANQNFERKMSGNSNLGNRRNSLEPQMRRTAFMNSSINMYNNRLKKTRIKLKEGIESMPLSKYEQWVTMKDINSFFLIFKSLRDEMRYLRQPDSLFKYYIAIQILLLMCIIFIQNISMPYWEWTTIVEICVMIFAVIILLPLTWTQYIWNNYYTHKNKRRISYDGEENSSDYESKNSYDSYGNISYMVSMPTHFKDVEKNLRPNNCFLKFMFNTSENIKKSFLLRTMIYMILCVVIIVCVFSEMSHCNYEESSAPRSDKSYIRHVFMFYEFIKKDTNYRDECVIPWHMTETCALAIAISFAFLRIHVWLKFVFGIIVTTVYSLIVLLFTNDYYENSEIYNYMMSPSIAHIINLVYLTFTLHLIDRQSDYMNRLDRKWNQQLIDEEKEANEVGKINSLLLQNLLPIHVVELYMDVNRDKGLYCEEYTNVSVMFASILYDIDESDEDLLIVMNQVIGDFDKTLSELYKNKIEKIKLANWTYMAACGLNIGRKNTDSSVNKYDDEDMVVVIMLKFAMEMRKILIRMNRSSQKNYKLRIGICNGEVIAGVVGSKKPLYDIWGDTVNMASRMDSTGIPHKVQVTERTANALKKYGYNCTYRDLIYVKGKSQNGQKDVPTYFVEFDDNNNLIKTDQPAARAGI